MGALTRRLVQALALASSDAALIRGPAGRPTTAAAPPARLDPVPPRPAAAAASAARCVQPHCCATLASERAAPEERERALLQRTKARSQAAGAGGSRARGAIRHRVISLFSKAQKAERKGDLETSRALLRDCLALDAADAHSWLALARLEADAGNESCARRIFEQACEACETNVRLLQAHGVFEARTGHAEAARACFRRCTALQSGNPYVAHAWGLMEERLGNVHAARAIYSECMSVAVQGEVAIALAALEARCGNLTAARNVYRSVEAAADAADASAAAPAPAPVAAESAAQAPLPPELLGRLLIEWASLERRALEPQRAARLLRRAEPLLPASAKGLLLRAQLRWERGERERARELLGEAEELPAAARGSGEWREQVSLFTRWAKLEASLRDAGSLERALVVLDRARRAGLETDGSLLQARGALQARAGDVAAARSSFRAAGARGGGAPVFVSWALLEEAEGNLEEARSLFARGIEEDVRHGPLHNARANFEIRRGNASGARAILQDAVLLAPECATLWHCWGQLERSQGRVDQAVDLWERGLGLSRGETPTAFLSHSLGSAHLKRNRPEAALAAFEGGLSRAPSNSQLLLGVALAHNALGRAGQAQRYLLRAVRAQPEHAHAWHAWAVLEARLERREAARDLFRQGLRQCPTHAPLWQAFAKFEADGFSEGGDEAEAEEALQGVRRVYRAGARACPDSQPLLVGWANFEMQKGNLDLTESLLEKARELSSDISGGELYHVQALLLIKQGERTLARECVEEGLRIAPRHAPLYKVLGSLQDAANEIEEARASFSKGLELQPDYALLYHAWARLEARLLNWEALNELNRKAQHAFPPGGAAQRGGAGRSLIQP